MYKESSQSFTSYDGLVLHGTLTMPESAPRSAALLVHGITSDRNELGFYERMSHVLAINGIASFRFEYRCHGENGLSMAQMSLSPQLSWHH